MNLCLAAGLKRLVIVATFACASFGTAWADREPLPQLAQDEAFVIARVSGKQLDRAWFEQINSKNSFVVGRSDGATLLRVKAGRYFLKKAKSKNSNIGAIGFPTPSDSRDTLDIKPGVISYIGDWEFNWALQNQQANLAMDWQMNEETVDYVRERNAIDALPTYTVRVGQPPTKLTNKVAQK